MGELDRYLGLLVGEAQEGFLEIRWRAPRHSMRRRFVALDRLGDADPLIRRLALSADVYVGCAPRDRRAGGLEAVVQVSWLWADLDSPAAVEALASFNPAPSVVIGSGSTGHLHVYWALERPVSATVAGAAMTRLQLRLGSDPAATHAAQILRPPETLNHKHSPSAAVQLLDYDERPIALEKLLADVPRLDGPKRSARELGPVLAGSGDSLRQIAPARYVEVLIGERPNGLGKVHCPFHSDSDPSLHVYSSPAGGWYCYSCRRGTDIYVLAGGLWGLSTRGRDFLELRSRLRALFALECDRAGRAA